MMNDLDDDGPQAAPRARPVRANPKMKPAMSKESSWIGFLVLGFGVLLVVTVGLLFLNQRSSAPGTVDTPSQAQQQALQQDPQPQGQQARQPSYDDTQHAPVTSENLSQSLKMMRKEDATAADPDPFDADALRDVAAADLRGVWEVQLTGYSAIVEMTDMNYRMIVASDDPLARRYYSNGTFEVRKSGLLVLTPDLSIRAPVDEHSYTPISRSAFPVIVQLQKEYMVWSVPGPGSEMVAPFNHPFLHLAKDQIAIWKKT